MITTSSRTFRNALTAYHNHIERRRSMARVRDLDDHMLAPVRAEQGSAGGDVR